MAVSRSLTSIMEEMVTEVMEDAVSTSIIYTQAPVKEVSNEEDRGGHEDDISCVVPEEFFSDLNPLDDAGAARLNQTRRRLFHMPSAAREVTRYKQIKLEEDEVENKNILEEQEAAALRGGEAEISGAHSQSLGEIIAEIMVEELLLQIVGEKAGFNVSSDFFSPGSSPRLQHPPPCSQDFAFFKAIEQTREDFALEDEEDSQENELAPPSQFLCSPSTSELGDLMKPRVPQCDHYSVASELEMFGYSPRRRGRRPHPLVTPGPGVQLLPLTQNCSLVTEQLDSQEDLFSSQEEEPEQKRRKTQPSSEDENCFEGGQSEYLVNNGVLVEENEWDQITDEDYALPLTFHTKDDILRKLQEMKHLSRGGEVSDRVLEQSGSKSCSVGEVEGKPTKKARRSVEKFSGVAMEKRVRGGVENGISSTGEIRKEVKREIKMEAVVEAEDSGKVKVTVADMERDERIWRHDSFEENSTLSGQPQLTDVVTKCRQPLLLHRPPRLGLSRLQKPSGIHDITIIKDISFNGDSEAECEVSFVKEE